MRTNRILVVVVLMVVTAVGFFVVKSRSTAQEGMTIKVVERAENDIVTDLGDEGDSVGDLLTFANNVYDETNENQVGTDNGFCVRTAPGVAWECIWTLTLEDGQITVEGPFLDTGDSTFAITGGTGDYMNARGQMTLTWLTPDGTLYDFTYEFVTE